MTTTALDQRIPFLDLVSAHLELEDKLVSVLKQALSTAGFIGGPMVEQFEQSFADYCGSRFCVGVSNGTDALKFVLLGTGVGQGDAVLTASNTFIATAEAISQVGAQPFFIDVNERTANIDPQKIEQFVHDECVVQSDGTLRTRSRDLHVRAVVPIHLYGQPADMDPILALAARYHLEVIEDACQAHGATYFSERESVWQKAGSMGRAAAFSFYPGKNLGACGEAGAITTDDAELALKVRMLRDHGQERKYHHLIEGYNGRLDAIQAGFLAVKLPYLDEWNSQRRLAAQWYREKFAAIADQVSLTDELPHVRSVYHLFVIHVPSRDRLREYLAIQNIETGIHYPVPLHLQKAYSHLGYKVGDFPVTERLASSALSLPMFPQLQVEHQQRVYDAIMAGLDLC